MLGGQGAFGNVVKGNVVEKDYLERLIITEYPLNSTELLCFRGLTNSVSSDKRSLGGCLADRFRRSKLAIQPLQVGKTVPATWSFNEANPSDIESEVTQVEQFNNDRLRLESSLVREVIQNSMDAQDKSEPVLVSFAVKELDEIGTAKLRHLGKILKPLEPHLEAGDIEMPRDRKVRLLCIEDFNTKGLTGSFKEKDGENFSNFWRIMGKSFKSRGQGGRRGLGKLVFAASSKLNTFFGVTRRKEDNNLFAMGHAILRNHVIGKTEYKPHGVWHNGRTDDYKKLQLPTSENDDLYALQFISSFKRKTEPGLTIIIPYLKEGITPQNIVDNVLKNYYFSILSNKLVVKVDDIVIDADSFEQVYKNSTNVRNTIPLDFVLSVRDAIRHKTTAIRSNLIDSSTIDTNKIPELLYSRHQIVVMREKFNNNEVVHVVVPIELYRKDGETKFRGEFNLFLQSLRKDNSAFKFFARGPIILTDESKKFKGNCLAGLIAEADDEVANFLGDAENPAHTEWSSEALLLKKNWKYEKPPLMIIRRSLKDLYNLIAKPEESKDNDLLSEFFSLPREQPDVEEGGNGTGSENGKPANPPPPSPPPVDLGFEIAEHSNGFEIRPDEGSKSQKVPKIIRIEMAYGRIGGNALRHFSELDFNLNDQESSIEVKSVQANINIVEANVIELDITGSDYYLNVMLKDRDRYRDLFVRARVTEWTM